MVPTTLTHRLRLNLSDDPRVWLGEVKTAVGVFEAQCQADLNFLSQQLRNARGGQLISARIAQEEDAVVAQLKCELVIAEARVVTLKHEVATATMTTETFRRLEEEYKGESEQLRLRMGQCSAEDATAQEVHEVDDSLYPIQ